MDFRILGPLEVVTEGQPLALGGTRQRAVLGVLLLHANETVSIDRLIDALWGESPPSGAVQSVRVYVSRLRKALEDGDAEGGATSVLVTTAGGYQLRVEDGGLDLMRFERLFTEGQRALADERPEHAAELLSGALALWRGPALADLAFEPFAQAEAARLDELRVAALEDRIEADLELGRHAAVASELEPLIAAASAARAPAAPADARALPLRAPSRGPRGLPQGPADARRGGGGRARPRAARPARGDPAPRSGARKAPATAPEAPALQGPEPPETARRAPRRVPAALVIAAIAAAVALLAIGLFSGGDEASTTIAENSVGLLDPATGDVRAQIPVGGAPGPSAADADSVWIADTLDDGVSRIDAESGQITRIDIGGEPAGVAVGEGFAWVANATEGTVAQVDPGANRVVGSLEVGNGPTGVAVAYGDLWTLASVDGALVRIDLARGEVTDRLPVGASPTAITAGAGSLWVADEAADALVRIEPDPGRVAEAIGVGHGPASVAFGEGAVWVANRDDGTVSRIDPSTDAVTSTVEVGADPSAIAVGDGAVWVANAGDGTVSRLEPDTGEVSETVEVGGSPSGLALAGGTLWTAVLASRESHRGGTLRVEWERPRPDLVPLRRSNRLRRPAELGPRRIGLRRPDDLPAGRRRGGLGSGCQPGHRRARAESRRQDVRVRAAAGYPLLRRFAGRAGGLPQLNGTPAACQRTQFPRLLQRHRGRPALRPGAPNVRPLARDRDRLGGQDDHRPPDRSRRRVSPQAHDPGCERGARGQPAALRPAPAAAGHRAVSNRRLRPPARRAPRSQP